MQSLGIIAIVAALAAGGLWFQSERIDGLKNDLKISQDTVAAQQQSIDDVKQSLERLDVYTSRLKSSVDKMKAENAELKDSLKYKDTIAHDSELAKKVVTDSFDKFSKDVQELTR